MPETILAGPILRRVETGRVLIWLATSCDHSVTASIFTDDQQDDQNIGKSRVQDDYPERIVLGPNLVIHLLTVTPNNGGTLFPTDTILYYRMSCKDPVLNQELQNLHQELALTGLDFPSFYIPQSLDSFLHGSCRKPHGPGQDALGSAINSLESSVKNLSKRPAAIFLTGDQIYADDVAAPLIRQLSRLGHELTGWHERIPGLGLHPNEMGLNQRMNREIENATGFTSGNGGNHLMTFGEYAAMYLMAWNENLWPQGLTQTTTQEISKWSIFKARKYRTEAQHLDNFKKSIHKVRKLFANISTYMIFDDHEVTDDWFLDDIWRKKIEGDHEKVGKKAGKRVIANALAAYWAFQGWGNSPEQFPKDFINGIVRYLGNNESSEQDAIDFDTRLWSFSAWEFHLKTNPAVIALDCRTRRSMNSGDTAPQLLDQGALDCLNGTWEKIMEGESDSQGLILLSPSPLHGFAPLEWLQKNIPFRAVMLDREAWSISRAGFGAFMNQLFSMNPKWTIVLSGDVHYSFSSYATFKPNPGQQMLGVRQLTSSPQKNIPSPLLRFAVKTMDILTSLKHVVKPKDGEGSWSCKITGLQPVANSEHRFKSIVLRNNVGLVTLPTDPNIHDVNHTLLGITDKSSLISFDFSIPPPTDYS
jgi:hypothetical protein